MAPVPGAPAGAPAGAAAGTPAGNVAGEQTTLVDTDRDISGSRGDTFGTNPVGGTVHTKTLRIPEQGIRIVARGIRSGANTPDRGTINVMADFGVGQGKQKDLIDGDLTITEPGATINVNPTGANLVTGRPFHSFSVAQRGGTLHSGTLTTEVTVVHER